MLVVFPPHASNFRQIVWAAPAQCRLVDIDKPVWIWCRPLQEDAAAEGALYSHELRRLSWQPLNEGAYLFDCNPIQRCSWIDGIHSGFCTQRVEALLQVEGFLSQVIAACLGWQSRGQRSMWCFCTHGKHRSQSARTLVCILTGAYRGGRRPRIAGWCNCGEISPARLCEVLTAQRLV